MKWLSFKVEKKCGEARAGVILTDDGEFTTPVFMPVGTIGAVKNLTPDELRSAGAKLLLANVYHLYLRPGVEVVEGAGGVRKFMGWEGAVLTDSGGFQIFSLARISRVEEEGVFFHSHIDGRKIFLSPETVYEIQRRIRSTIAMPLDHPSPTDASKKEVEEAMNRTTRWLDRTCAFREGRKPILFGIVQGGIFEDLRLKHVEEVSSRDIDGVAIGGLSLGEDRQVTGRMIEVTAPALPEEKPRYLMGMGKPHEILFAIRCGVDMFDCVFPTRGARHGLVLSSKGNYSIRLKRWKGDGFPLDEDCGCYTCRNFDRRYLRHLYMCGEALSGRLISLHNVHFCINLVNRARDAIISGAFEDFYNKWFPSLSQKL